MAHSEIFRLYYGKNAYGYYLRVVGEQSGKVAGVKSNNRPKVEQTRAWLASKGFEAYGDMLRLSDGSFVSMVKKIS